MFWLSSKLQSKEQDDGWVKKLYQKKASKETPVCQSVAYVITVTTRVDCDLCLALAYIQTTFQKTFENSVIDKKVGSIGTFRARALINDRRFPELI